jgi:antitoxin component YwqK of YwqJK toxin-antitoxin module
MANAQLEDKIFVIPAHVMKFVKPGTMRSDFILRRKDEITYYNIKRLKHFFDVEKEKDQETYEALGGDEMETWVNKVLDTHRSMSLKGKRIRSDVGMQNVFKKSHFKQSENGIYSKPKIFRPETKARQLWTGKGLYEGMFKPRNLDSRLDVWNKQQPEKDGVKINQYNETGQPNGYWDNWVDDEMIVGKGNFVKGKKHGEWEEYLFDGELVGKGNYFNGKESGIWEFYEDGKVTRKEFLHKGKMIGRWYPVKDNLGESNLFKPRNLGSRYDKWNSEQPEIDGVQINQYDNDGKKTGLWEYNFHNGAKSLKHYENGKLNGYAKYIWNNGNLSAEGIYGNNKQVGIWKHYNQDGELLSQTKK